MRITACRAFRYALPLYPSVTLGGQSLLTRQGLIIRLEDQQGHWGYGEAAPLPGFHQENLEAVVNQFQALTPWLINREVPPHLADLQNGFADWLDRDKVNLWPSLRFGLETAVLNLLAGARQVTLAGLLADHYPKTLPINGLLLESDSPEQAEQLGLEGYTAVKLKVGRHALEQDIARVHAVRAVLDKSVALRLDANRSWDLATALRFAEAVADCAIEHIEEPLADPQALTQLSRLTCLPIALDESLVDNPAQLPTEGIGAFILKPAVLGGWEKTAALIRMAKDSSLKTVVSSAFESGVGLAALANGAAALCQPGVPMGLDTYRWLGEDVLEERFSAPNGRVQVDSVHHQAGQLRLS